MELQNQVLLATAQTDGALTISSLLCDALQLGPLLPSLTVDSNKSTATSRAANQKENESLEIVTEYSQPALQSHLTKSVTST